jgi:hypothetical protein
MADSNTTDSAGSGKKFDLDPDNSCACDKCSCCHHKVSSKGDICGKCAGGCQKFLVISGGLVPVERKGGAGLGS